MLCERNVNLTNFFYTSTSVLITSHIANTYGNLKIHYVWCKNIHINKTKTSIMKNAPCLSADLQACTETPPIYLNKVELYELHATHIINVEIWRNPSEATSETYKINMSTFDDGQPW